MGLRGSSYICTQGTNKYARLCLFKDADEAIYFEFETAPQIPPPTKPITVTHETKQENFSMTDSQIAHDNSSIYDLISMASSQDFEVKNIEGFDNVGDNSFSTPTGFPEGIMMDVKHPSI